jgi:hypothetical protein
MRLLGLLGLLLPFTRGHPIRCLSFSGLETERYDLQCTWVKPVEYYLDMVKHLDFDTIRLPFSKQYVDNGDLSKMDNFIQQTYLRNISVILDYHRTFNSHQGADIYEGGATLDQFIATWLRLLDRYVQYPNVIGHNAMNEPTGSDPQPILYWTGALFDAVEKRFGNRYQHYVTGTMWSSNLRGMSLEDRPYHDRIYYSLHIYPFSNPSNEESWEWNLAGIPVEKLIVGEFGGVLPKDEKWIDSFLAYVHKKGIQHTCFWNLVMSRDTTNIVSDADCMTINWDMYNKLKQVWI